MSGETEFNRLLVAAKAFAEDYESDPTDAFNALLAHIKAHPENRKQHGVDVLATLHDGPDIFDFVMSRLKWPEVKEQLHSLMTAAAERGDRRAQFYYGGCLNCFERDYPV